MISWFVAHTQPQKELIAQIHLAEQGFSVYLPQFRKIRRHARKVDEVLSPLFPRYIFVGLDLESSHWRSVNGTRGVSYLLVDGNNRPAQMPSRTIENLKSQELSGGILPVSSLESFARGQQIRVLDGAFKDHVAIYETMDDKQRVQLLLSFMGRDIQVSVPIYAVEAA